MHFAALNLKAKHLRLVLKLRNCQHLFVHTFEMLISTLNQRDETSNPYETVLQFSVRHMLLLHELFSFLTFTWIIDVTNHDFGSFHIEISSFQLTKIAINENRQNRWKTQIYTFFNELIPFKFENKLISIICNWKRD